MLARGGIASREDADVSATISQILAGEGVRIVTGAREFSAEARAKTGVVQEP